MLAGEPPAESFDRLPPRRLAPSRESWRFSISQRLHPTDQPWHGVYARTNLQSIDSYTAGGPMASLDNKADLSEQVRMEQVGRSDRALYPSRDGRNLERAAAD